MRQFRVLLIVFALVGAGALTGCFGKDDEGDGGDTNTSTGGGSGGTGSGSGGTGGGGTGGGTGGNTTAPPPPPKPRDVNETFSITLGTPTPPATAPQGEHPFNVPGSGWRTFTVSVSAAGPAATAPFLADGVDVSLLDPAGTEVGKVSFAAGPPGAAQSITAASGPAGEWKIVAKAKTAGVQAAVSGTIAIAY